MSQLTKNTIDLDALIAKANALPNAGAENLTAVLDAQEQLINEIEAELEGKTAGGSGGSAQPIEITLKRKYPDSNDPAFIVHRSLVNGEKTFTSFTWEGGDYVFTCEIGDVLYIRDTNGDLNTPEVTDNIAVHNPTGDTVYDWIIEYLMTPNSGTVGTITM